MNDISITSAQDVNLLELFSTPRISGSAAEAEVYSQTKAWLSGQDVAFEEQPFTLYPWIWPCIGAWLILSRTLLAVAVWQQWGWVTLPIGILGLLGGLVDISTDIPLVSWIGAVRRHNLLIHFDCPGAVQEIILSAHYDSKTELLDHRQRMFFVRGLPFGIVLTLLLAFIGPLQSAAASTPTLSGALHWIGVLLSIPMLFLAWGLGLNLLLGRLRPQPSQGAVDNGAACVILLKLAQRIKADPGLFQNTRLTLALFGGEEVGMQGSRAFVRERLKPAITTTSRPENRILPCLALNLEVMAQNGDYVIWEQDGISIKLWPNSPSVIAAASAAVEAVTGMHARCVGPVNSDGGSFARVGIPSATLGTYDRQLADRGFHQPSDNIRRVIPERIPEAVTILEQFIRSFDNEPAGFPHRYGENHDAQ